jgi:hypothetical protein
MILNGLYHLYFIRQYYKYKKLKIYTSNISIELILKLNTMLYYYQL